jgi:hypothetical protein
MRNTVFHPHPMRVWTVSFFLFLALAELYQWLQGVTPPLPIWIGAGALLAIASNIGRNSPLEHPTPSSVPASAPPPQAEPIAEPKLPPKLAHTQGLAADETPELPPIPVQKTSPPLDHSISFKIWPQR